MVGGLAQDVAPMGRQEGAPGMPGGLHVKNVVDGYSGAAGVGALRGGRTRAGAGTRSRCLVVPLRVAAHRRSSRLAADAMDLPRNGSRLLCIWIQSDALLGVSEMDIST